MLEGPHLANPADGQRIVAQQANAVIARHRCLNERGGSVEAAAVDDEDFAHHGALRDQPLETWSDATCLVQRRYDDAYRTASPRITQRCNGGQSPASRPEPREKEREGRGLNEREQKEHRRNMNDPAAPAQPLVQVIRCVQDDSVLLSPLIDVNNAKLCDNSARCRGPRTILLQLLPRTAQPVTGNGHEPAFFLLRLEA